MQVELRARLAVRKHPRHKPALPPLQIQTTPKRFDWSDRILGNWNGVQHVDYLPTNYWRLRNVTLDIQLSGRFDPRFAAPHAKGVIGCLNAVQFQGLPRLGLRLDFPGARKRRGQPVLVPSVAPQ